jgi:hypothetical protein
MHLALESDYFPASIAIYAVDPLESRRSQFLKMAEAVAKERWEIAISGKDRLAAEELARKGGVNIRIHTRSLEEVRFIFVNFHCILAIKSPPPWLQMKGEAMHAVLEVSS